ncbi:MAG: hypothetical protein ACXAEU_00525 [Candidatus Hodarchaeales archaeon]|jgi:hypothetical protein
MDHDISGTDSEMNDSDEKEDLTGVYLDSEDELTSNETRPQDYPSDSVEREILDLFITKNPVDWSYTFSGIRRLLGTHQQTLTNALDRMIDDSILVKHKSGYQLNERIKNPDLVPDHVPNTIKRPRDWLLARETVGRDEEEVWIGTSPNFFPVAAVAKKLAGKWFDSFRFTGSSINSRKDQATLEWVNVLDVSMRMTVEIAYNQVMVKLKNMRTLGTVNSCLNFIQNVVSKQRIILYFDADNLREYGHDGGYNN